MVCERCLGEILNPVEHEWCRYRTAEAEEVAVEAEVELPTPYVAPKAQEKIIHEFAPPNMKAVHRSGIYYSSDEYHDDSFSANARRLLET